MNTNLHRTLAIRGPLHEASLITDDKQAIELPPQLFFAGSAWRQLSCYYRSIQTEFQLMGFVEQEERNMFRVTELAINPQYAGYGHARNAESKFADFLRELEAKGKNVDTLRFQAHSHGRFSTYFSPDDVDTIRHGYACDWMISMVGNLRSEFLARLDIFCPVPISIALPIFIEQGTGESPAPDPRLQEEQWLSELRSRMTFERKGGARHD